MKAISHANSWVFPDGAVFPVVGSDEHPLKLHSRGLLGRGILAAVVLHFSIFGAWIVQRGLNTGDLPELVLPGPDRVIRLTELLPPPPIQPRVDPGVTQSEVEAIMSSASGVPHPVDDFLAPDVRFQSPEDGVDDMDPVGLGDFGNAGGPVVIDPSSVPPSDPDPDGFVAYEDAPQAIQTPAPVYPEMARAAEVEGTVVVRMLVNKEGRVEKASVVSGHPMLDAAALDAVRNWIFKPALQQHKPVAVWLAVPIKFVLH